MDASGEVIPVVLPTKSKSNVVSGGPLSVCDRLVVPYFSLPIGIFTIGFMGCATFLNIHPEGCERVSGSFRGVRGGAYVFINIILVCLQYF